MADVLPLETAVHRARSTGVARTPIPPPRKQQAETGRPRPHSIATSCRRSSEKGCEASYTSHPGGVGTDGVPFESAPGVEADPCVTRDLAVPRSTRDRQDALRQRLRELAAVRVPLRLTAGSRPAQAHRLPRQCEVNLSPVWRRARPHRRSIADRREGRGRPQSAAAHAIRADRDHRRQRRRIRQPCHGGVGARARRPPQFIRPGKPVWLASTCS